MRITVEFPIGDELLYGSVEYRPDAMHELGWPYVTRSLAKQLTDEVHAHLNPRPQEKPNNE